MLQVPYERNLENVLGFKKFIDLAIQHLRKTLPID